MAVTKWSVSVDEEFGEVPPNVVEQVDGSWPSWSWTAKRSQHSHARNRVLNTTNSSGLPCEPRMPGTPRSGYRIPVVVLVELYRGAGTDEAIDLLLDRGFALVVATAVRFGGGAIVAHDPGDISLLAARHSNVSVIAI